MNGGEILISLCINCFVIYILHILHKRSISKTIENVRKEIYELENLVAAIMEEFEEVADEVLQTDIKKPNDEPFENETKTENLVEKPNELPDEDFIETEGLKKEESEEQNFNQAFSDDLEFDQQEPLDTIPMFQPHEIIDPRHNRILQLWKDGLAIEEIAKQLGTGRGEVQLILGIYKRG
ncbi:MAG: hypothetical protein GXY86_10595 [Firmicutes bacterium]|nr:hypothetical protein [Bacillota bacterium]